MERFVIPVEHLTQHHPLPGLALRDLFMTGGSTKTPGQVGAWFNASSVVHKGKRWMVYRTECPRWFLWSRISIVQLTDDFIPIPGANKLLPLHTRFEGWGAEDPRLFIFKDDMYMSYGDGYRMLFAKFDENGHMVFNGNLPLNVPDMNPPQDHPREKNWGFFEFDGKLFCQQDVAPLRTWEFNPGKFEVTNRYGVDWKWRSVYGMRLNGGAPPVFHGGYLWRWVHTHRTEELPEPRKVWWSGDLQKTGHRYYPFLACFKPEPPFAPVAISREPIFFSEWNDKNHQGPTHYSVSYVGSSERERDGWRLVLGENDCRIVTLHVTDQEANATMEEIKIAPPRPVKSLGRNVLHFIWFQGEPPEEDNERILQWKNMNLDWEIKVWDRESLTHLIFGRGDKWSKVWEDLLKAIDKNPEDTALIAKASDLARLLLLSIKWNGQQTWNAYADTDTTPHRSLTSFLNDHEIQGGSMGKNVSFSGFVSDRPWDSDKYDLIVSQENLLTPHMASLTNAVMLARPESLAIDALLKAGYMYRNRPTLKAYGPSMLRDSVEALKRTEDGARIDILPYHYLVWNQKQMRMSRPEWTVCSHHNQFRWFQPDVKTSNAGATRASVLN